MKPENKAIAGNMQRFFDLVDYARQHSTLYRDLYGSLDLSARSYDSIRSMPTIGPDQMHQSGPPDADALLTGPMSSGYITRSGGSSGKEKYALTSYDEVATGTALLGKMFSLCGINKEDRVANLFMPGHMYSAFASVCRALELTGCLQLPIGANTEPELIFRYLSAFRPNVLLAVPSLIMQLAERVKKGNLPIRFNKIGYAGEHLSEVSREYIRSVFEDVAIFSLGYAAVDTGIIAYQDSSCSGSRHKIPVEHVFVEILDPVTGEHAAFGDEGDIVVTNLFRKLMPVIRYHIGDRGILRRNEDGGDPILDLLGRSGSNIMLCGYEIGLDAFSQVLAKTAIGNNYQLGIRPIDATILLTISFETEDQGCFPDAAEIQTTLCQQNELLKTIFDAGILQPLQLKTAKPGELLRNKVTGKLIQVIDERPGGSTDGR